MKRYWLFIFGISVVIVAIVVVTVHFLNGNKTPVAPTATTTTTTTIMTITTNTATTVSSTPTAPGDFSFESSKNTVVLRWTVPSDLPDGYHIYRDMSLVATLPGNSTMFQDEGLVPAHRYSYSVSAFFKLANLRRASWRQLPEIRLYALRWTASACMIMVKML